VRYVSYDSCVRTLLAAAIFIGGRVSLCSQNDTQRIDNGARKMLQSKDTVFAIQAIQGGIAEIELGKLAAEKGMDAEVKAFGRHMVEDHGRANEKLTAIGARQKMMLPAIMNSREREMYDKLQTTSGEAFDRMYVSHMIKDHEEDIKEFRKEADRGQDEDIRNFASQTLPVLQEHLEKIKAIRSKM
jgi:putative membrane protein